MSKKLSVGLGCTRLARPKKHRDSREGQSLGFTQIMGSSTGTSFSLAADKIIRGSNLLGIRQLGISTHHQPPSVTSRLPRQPFPPIPFPQKPSFTLLFTRSPSN